MLGVIPLWCVNCLCQRVSSTLEILQRREPGAYTDQVSISQGTDSDSSCSSSLMIRRACFHSLKCPSLEGQSDRYRQCTPTSLLLWDLLLFLHPGTGLPDFAWQGPTLSAPPLCCPLNSDGSNGRSSLHPHSPFAWVYTSTKVITFAPHPPFWEGLQMTVTH